MHKLRSFKVFCLCKLWMAQPFTFASNCKGFVVVGGPAFWVNWLDLKESAEFSRSKVLHVFPWCSFSNLHLLYWREVFPNSNLTPSWCGLLERFFCMQFTRDLTKQNQTWWKSFARVFCFVVARKIYSKRLNSRSTAVCFLNFLRWLHLFRLNRRYQLRWRENFVGSTCGSCLAQDCIYSQHFRPARQASRKLIVTGDPIQWSENVPLDQWINLHCMNIFEWANLANKGC